MPAAFAWVGIRPRNDEEAVMYIAEKGTRSLADLDELLKKQQDALEDELATTRRELFVLGRLKEIERKLDDLSEWVKTLLNYQAKLARLQIAKRYTLGRRTPIRPKQRKK
jgi:hypothetical protein